MNIQRLNESFSNKYRNHEIIDNSFKARLKNNLNESVNKLLSKGDTNISSLERALQEELERFTNKDWWEVTEVNIFGNLFESRDPHKTIDDIVENLKEGIDDDIEFVDNRKASIIYNDPELDPGFDEYDVKEEIISDDIIDNEVIVESDNILEQDEQESKEIDLEEAKKKRSKLLDKVNKALSESNDCESIEEDLEEDDYFDLQSDLYNKLSDIMFKYRYKDISERDLDNAFEHFKVRFFEDKEESLNEARNKDNLEINDKIAQALRSKFQAKKYEKELNDLGIKVQYSYGQGTILTGPNGRTLSASRKTIFGPSAPKFNGTHRKSYIPTTDYEEKYLKRAQDNLDKLQSLIDKADANILSVAYPGLSFEEATEKLTADFEKAKDDVKKYTDRLSRERKDRDRALRDMHSRRKAGHSSPWINDTEIEASVKESPIDFLTYLTKEKSALRTNKYTYERTPKIAKYHDLNDTIKRAESSLNWNKQYHQVLDQSELQAKLDALEAEFEAKVQNLLRDQDRNKNEIRKSYDKVDKAKKDKADYLKSLGIGN